MSARTLPVLVVLIALAAVGVVIPAAEARAAGAAGGDGDGDGAGAGAGDGVIALVGGEVLPVSGAVLPVGTVLVEGGLITAVGADVDVPAGATVIDCSGKIVTPGLIDADSALGLDAATLTGRLPGADVVAADTFDAWDARLRTALRQGVTTLHLGAGRTQTVGGLASVVSIGRPGAAPFVRDGALVVNVSTTAAASGLPGAARVAGIRALFIAAQYREDGLERWRRDLAEYEEERLVDAALPEERLLLPPELLERMRRWSPGARAAWRVAAYKSMGRPKSYTKPKKPRAAPRTPGDDPNMETIASVLGVDDDDDDDDDGVRRAFLRAELSGDVGAALSMVRDFDLTAVIAGGEGLRARADELVKARVGIVLTSTGDTSLPRTSPLARRLPGLGAALAAKGLRPAIASGGAAPARFLRLLAAREAGEGMSPGEALAAVTLWAAEAAGVADRAGSLAVGKRADVVVWDGDPLAAASRAAHVLVAGREVDLASR